MSIIARVDTRRIYCEPLAYDVGDGAGEGWPLCGPVSASLGSDAVIAWRSVLDREQWEKDGVASHQSTEEILSRLAAEAKDKRKKRKGGA